MNDELYDQLEQAMAEAENSRREAFEESTRLRKAKKDAIDAVRRVSFLLYAVVSFSFLSGDGLVSDVEYTVKFVVFLS